MSKIFILRHDNFTPKERTPWGGREILKLKKGLGIKHHGIVGESWEISDHKSFPNSPVKLSFLAKLLNSEKDLSVQVHPAKGYKRSAPSKTEGWLILKAKKDAGIYLGLKKGVSRKDIENVLTAGKDLTKLLNFVKVKTGDVFFIPAGTPHAIGAGLLIYEPQERSETTYRFYDYGSSRELHIKDALAVTNWSGLRGKELVKNLRRIPKFIGDHEEELINEKAFKLHRITLGSSERYEGHCQRGVHGLTVIEGMVDVSGRSLSTGQSAIVTNGKYVLEGKGKRSVILKVFV